VIRAFGGTFTCAWYNYTYSEQSASLFLLNTAHTRQVLGTFGHEVSPFTGAELGGRWESLSAYHAGQRKQSSHLQQETLLIIVTPVFQLWEICCWSQVINI